MADPTSQPKTQTLACIECECVWDVPSERWRLYLTDDTPAEAVAYCHACAQREFG
jgi:hypothetical protein